MTIRYAGLSIMVGVILTFVGSLFLPGTIIDPVDQTDFPKVVLVLGDWAVLAQWVTLIWIVATLLMLYGLLSLYPLASRQEGLGGRLLQFGIIATAIEWTALIVAGGMRHFVIHLMQRAKLDDHGSLTPADFTESALAVYTAMIAVTLVFVALFPFGSGLTGLGLSFRFGSMNVYKIGAYLMALCGLVGLVNFLISMSAPDIGLNLLLYVNNLALFVGGIGLFIIGLGMYRGREGLTEEG